MKNVKMLIAAVTIASSLVFVGCGEDKIKYECSDRQKAIDYCYKCLDEIQLSNIDDCTSLRQTFNNDGEVDSAEETVLSAIKESADKPMEEIDNILIILENKSIDLTESEINDYYLDVKKEYNQYFNIDNNQE